MDQLERARRDEKRLLMKRLLAEYRAKAAEATVVERGGLPAFVLRVKRAVRRLFRAR